MGLPGILGWVPVARQCGIESVLPPAPPRLHHSKPHAGAAASPLGTKVWSLSPATQPLPRLDATREDVEHSLTRALQNDTIIPDEIPIKPEIGKCLGLMRPTPPYGVDHATIPLLHKYAQEGFPVECGKPWPRDLIEALLHQVAHHSTISKQAIQQLWAETMENIN